MALGYQEEVGDFINYNNTLSPFGFYTRGPIYLQDKILENSISFLGAAQTYGTWCEYPFPWLVANGLSLNCFNLGHAGAGPRAFLNPDIIKAINKTKFCIIQVMSGRSVSNRYMKQVAGAARVRLNHPLLPEETLLAHVAYAKLLNILSHTEMEDLISESIVNLLNEYKQLSQLITVPKLLLWISSRHPKYKRNYDSVGGLLGSFPHLIDEPTYQKMASLFTHSLIVASDKLIDRPLWSETKMTNFTVERPWGKIERYSRHYSHPYLHVLAAQMILEKIHEIAV